MKRLVMAVTLTCVLSCSALAGDVPSVGFTSQDPGGTTQTAQGDIPSGDAAQPVSSAALSFIQAVIGLLI